jgi:hypothetical protein
MRKESKSGSPCSSVYVRRRSHKVRRRQSGTSGDVVFGLRARGASLSSGEASRGIGWGGGGLEWPVHGGRGSGAAGTPCAERAPVNLRLGEAESERGCTVKALVGFIGVGVGAGSGVARRTRDRASGRALALSGRVEHVAISFCPSSSSC